MYVGCLYACYVVCVCGVVYKCYLTCGYVCMYVECYAMICYAMLRYASMYLRYVIQYNVM